MEKNKKDQASSEIIYELEKVPMSELSRERDLRNDMPDNLTSEQRKRDAHTSTLYKLFVDAYKNSRQFAKTFKLVICIWGLVLVSCMTIACVILSFYILMFTERQPSDIIALISAIIPLVVSIIGLLTIITKHIFPENEEKHVTEIVKLVHENDLKNKRENIRQHNGNGNSGFSTNAETKKKK